MKSPNGYGSVSKLSGTRRRPYMVQITTGYDIDEDSMTVKRKRSTLGYYATRKEAMIALAEYNRNPYNTDKSKATVEDIWLIIKDKIKASEARKGVYERCWNKYMEPIKKRPIMRVEGQELCDIVDACPYGYSTKVVIRTILKHIYSYAIQNKYIDIDLTPYIKIEQEAVQLQRQIYTPEEIRNLWEHKDEELYKFTLILLYQGMRITELRELPLENIDIEAGAIKITKAKNAQSIRTIPIHDKAKPLIQELIDASDGAMLVNFHKNKYDYFCKTVLGHAAYDTRHTFATKCNELDLKKVVVQRIMGHKPDSILEQYYTHLSLEELREVLNKIEY